MFCKVARAGLDTGSGAIMTDTMRILAIDVGTGTQDILLFDSTQPVENALQLIMPSPTQIAAGRIRRATRSAARVVPDGGHRRRRSVPLGAGGPPARRVRGIRHSRRPPGRSTTTSRTSNARELPSSPTTRRFRPGRSGSSYGTWTWMRSERRSMLSTSIRHSTDWRSDAWTTAQRRPGTPTACFGSITCAGSSRAGTTCWPLPLRRMSFRTT